MVVFQKGQYEGCEKPVLLVQEGPLQCYPCVWGCHYLPVGGYLPSGGDPVQGLRLGCIVLGASPPKPLYVDFVNKSYKDDKAVFPFWYILWGKLGFFGL